MTEKEKEMRQMTLFDLEPVDCIDFETTPEEDVVQLISNAIGVKFNHKGDPWGWVANPSKHLEMDIKYGRYTCRDREGILHINCGYSYHKNGQVGGAGSPCDTIEDAIKFMRNGLERWA